MKGTTILIAALSLAAGIGIKHVIQINEEPKYSCELNYIDTRGEVHNEKQVINGKTLFDIEGKGGDLFGIQVDGLFLRHGKYAASIHNKQIPVGTITCEKI